MKAYWKYFKKKYFIKKVIYPYAEKNQPEWKKATKTLVFCFISAWKIDYFCTVLERLFFNQIS